uniref:Uncharacterized protein n=1 Tax=Caenorhabditis japonica TaxID=281687 RepID=A0A8R1EFR0_CAEJA
MVIGSSHNVGHLYYLLTIPQCPPSPICVNFSKEKQPIEDITNQIELSIYQGQATQLKNVVCCDRFTPRDRL